MHAYEVYIIIVHVMYSIIGSGWICARVCVWVCVGGGGGWGYTINMHIHPVTLAASI